MQKLEIPMESRTLVVEGLPILDPGDRLVLKDLEDPLLVMFEDFLPEAVTIVPGGVIAYVRFANAIVAEEAMKASQGAMIGDCVISMKLWSDLYANIL